MAANTANSLKEYRAALPAAATDLLGNIRDWDNLQIATDEDTIWLKGFTEVQYSAPEIRQLPGLLLYELRDGLLFLKDALVPSRKMRTALLWSPIDKALRLSMPGFNHNFFGIHEKIAFRLLHGGQEQPAFALYAKMKDIFSIISTSPKFKLDMLQWVVADDMALITGTPLLSFPGKTYWHKDGHLLPSGFDFEFKNLSGMLQQKYNAAKDHYLLWEPDGGYISIPSDAFTRLSLSSFRLTAQLR